MLAFAYTSSYRAANGIFGKIVNRRYIVLRIIKSDWFWYGNVKSAKVKILGFFRKSVRFGLIFDTVILCGVDDFSILYRPLS